MIGDAIILAILLICSQLSLSTTGDRARQPIDFHAGYIVKCCSQQSDSAALLNCSREAARRNSADILAKSSSRLAVVTFATEDISHYSAYSAAINEAYCEYYGCSFLYFDSESS
jgi:hypothetical protein